MQGRFLVLGRGRSNPSVFWRLARTCAALACLSLVGCTEDTKIRTYKVAKGQTSAESAKQANAQGTADQQMLAAILPQKDGSWFFKMTGDPNKVAETEAQFKEIIQSVKFKGDGQPSWELKNGWVEQPGNSMTFAKLAQTEKGLTATVSQLVGSQASDDASWSDWVNLNVNRWRKQLSLEEQDWQTMQKELQELEALNQMPAKAYYVRLIGKGSGQMGGPSGNAPAMPPAPIGRGSPPPSQVKYEVPPGWSEKPASGMRLATFNLDVEGMQAEVTIISAGGDKRSNVARWQRQLIPTADDAMIDGVMQAADKFEVNGVPAELYYILGEPGPEQGSFLAAIIEWRPEASLFIKMIGPAKLAEQQRAAFTGFVKSMKW
jgi:hypothetical protein